MKIAVLEPLNVSRETLDREAAQLPDDVTISYADHRPADDDELVAWAAGAEVLVIANLPLRRAVLERLPEVRCISVAFVGVDHVDLDYCTEHGIVVSNCPGYSQEAVAELVFGLALALYRDIPVADDRVREGGTAAGLSGREISGKTFGIIGAGAIGRRVAQIARALGATVVAWNRTPRTVEGIEFLPLDEVLKRADILSVHVASTPETHHLIGAEQLALLKPSAILINTARGPVVDSGALAEALTAGTLAGAGLDVFDTEPPLDQSEPLLTAPHTILTPHLGFATHEALETRAHLVFENIAAYTAGAPVHTVC